MGTPRDGTKPRELLRVPKILCMEFGVCEWHAHVACKLDGDMQQAHVIAACAASLQRYLAVAAAVEHFPGWDAQIL